MRKKTKGYDFELLQGGKLAETAARSKFARVRRRWLAEIGEESATRRQAGKYFDKLAAPLEHDDDAIAGLRRITERLAKRKLAAPRRVFVPPGVWGSYTLRFAPPYRGLGTYVVGQISSVTGNPTISATGVDNLGQLSCSVYTDFDSPSAGTASNLMGVYFKPVFSRATARIYFESEFSFAWVVNSIQNKLADSRAQGLIQLFQYDSGFVQPALRTGAFIGWSMVAQNELDFDFISETGPTWYLEAPVSSSHFYFVVISLTCTASGEGWPGSLAGASATVTVPSISVEVTSNPPVAQL